MTNETLYGITGATGELGGRVARGLSQAGASQRMIVRDTHRAPELHDADVAIASGYRDRSAMTEALRGADTLFLVSGRESADRVAEHVSAVDAAIDAGVSRIVYTSFVGAAPDATFTLARDHFATEEHIKSTGIAFTFLRDSLYLDFVPTLASREGLIAGPAGSGKFAAVARDDVADVAVVVLTGDSHDGATYDLTGPQAFTMAYAAEQLTAFSGRPVAYKDESIDEAYVSRASYGAPKFEVDGWVSSYLAIAVSELDVVTDTVQRLTGHAPQSLPDYLTAHPESYAHLKQN
jgi:NAD(P)H dehydrogenase (quinone)